MKRITYIANNLTSVNPTTTAALTDCLASNGWRVRVFGKSKVKLLRLIEMCLGVLFSSSHVVLIDTYSTLNFYYALICGAISKLKGTPYILILHGGDLPKRIQKNRKLSLWLFNNASRVISPSPYLKTALKAFDIEVKVIPNPMDLSQYPWQKREVNQPVLLWVRAFHQIYNPVMAVEVLHQLKPRFPESKLIMVGPDKDGTLRAVEDKIISCNLKPDVTITGKLTKQEWIDLSKMANVFINTSTVDNTPVSVIEAMALGLPVVSTNVGGLPFLIDSNHNGILVTTAKEMTDAVTKLCLDTHLYKSISKTALITAENCEAKTIGDMWNEILSSC